MEGIKVIIKRHLAKVQRGKLILLDKGTEISKGDPLWDEEIPISENIQKVASDVANFNREKNIFAIKELKDRKQFLIIQKYIIQENS